MPRFWRILPLVLFSLAATVVPRAFASGNEIDPDTMSDLGIIARVTANIFSNQEYTKHPIDDALSQTLFEEYVDTLDPSKVFLTREDVAAFAENKKQLDDQLKRGDVKFAFQLYDCLLERLKQYRSFAKTEIKKGFDFTKDEYYVFDREKVERPSNADQKELWRKRLKNDLLSLRLADKAMMDAAAKKSGGNAPGDTKKTAKDKKGVDASSEDSGDEKFANLWRKSPKERILKRLDTLITSLEKRRPVERLEFYLGTLGRVLDPHSTYFAPRTSEDFDINMKLSLVGIGAVLSQDDNGYTKIVSVIPGGPADKDGRLEKEDRIAAVGQDGGEPVDIVDMPLTDVVQMIRGKLGTRVDLYVLKGAKGIHGVPQVISLVRDKVTLKNQEAKGEIRKVKADGKVKKIGIIDVPSFYIDFHGAAMHKPDYKSVTRDVKRILERFAAEKVDGVIVDLRENGGGSLAESIKMTGLFIDSGPVVQVKNSYSKTPSVERDNDGKTYYSGPLLVLIDRLSASAAEIFAAAIQDYGRGIIVGDARTHGKGTVQTIFSLRDCLASYGLKMKPGQLKVTIAKFYRINGDSTQRHGVTPDIVLPDLTDAMDNLGEDNLKHALPWDSIEPSIYETFSNLKPLIPGLRGESEKRVAASPKFQEAKKLIARLKEINKREKISLNEAKRLKMMEEDKKVSDEQMAVFKRATSGNEGTKPDDIFIDEAVNIMIDMLKSAVEKKGIAADERGADAS
jgi:carboxyl-terminal processing protease